MWIIFLKGLRLHYMDSRPKRSIWVVKFYQEQGLKWSKKRSITVFKFQDSCAMKCSWVDWCDLQSPKWPRMLRCWFWLYSVNSPGFSSTEVNLDCLQQLVESWLVYGWVRGREAHLINSGEFGWKLRRTGRFFESCCT